MPSIGAAAEPAGLLYATGFSGHGFQQGLVVGEHLAQLALGLEPSSTSRSSRSSASRAAPRAPS